jgi:hypothetical protein
MRKYFPFPSFSHLPLLNFTTWYNDEPLSGDFVSGF